MTEFPGELDERFVGFRTTIAEYRFTGMLHDSFGNEFAKFPLLTDLIPVGAVDEFAPLPCQCLGDSRRAVS